jgi:hypothetical protein
MGTALAVERIVEAAWAALEIAISGSVEETLEELKTSVVFKNIKRGFSIVIAVCIGIGKPYKVRSIILLMYV